jgi:hypothetical protein
MGEFYAEISEADSYEGFNNGFIKKYYILCIAGKQDRRKLYRKCKSWVD